MALVKFGDNHFCTGVVVSDEWIITSATCFKDRKDTKKGIIYLGATNENDAQQKHKIAKIVVEPSFTKDPFKHNEAAIKTVDRITLSSKVWYAYMAFNDWPPEAIFGRSCTIVQYVKGDGGKISLYSDINTLESGPDACTCGTVRSELEYGAVICAKSGETGGCYSYTSAAVMCDEELAAVGNVIDGCDKPLSQDDNIKNCDKDEFINLFSLLVGEVEWMRSIGIVLPDKETDVEANFLRPKSGNMTGTIPPSNKTRPPPRPLAIATDGQQVHAIASVFCIILFVVLLVG